MVEQLPRGNCSSWHVQCQVQFARWNTQIMRKMHAVRYLQWPHDSGRSDSKTHCLAEHDHNVHQFNTQAEISCAELHVETRHTLVHTE